MTCRQLPYTIFVHKDNQRDAEAWCRERFGKRWEAIGYRDGTWACFWAGYKHFRMYLFLFKNEHDALLFALRFM